MNKTPSKKSMTDLHIETPASEENVSPNIVRVSISTPAKPVGTPTSDEVVAAGRRLSGPVVDDEDDNSEDEDNSQNHTGSDYQCEMDSLKEQLQQALDDKAELIEESLIDKERIKDQKETIELLTKRIREFEMSRSTSNVTNSGSAGMSLPAPTRTRSATTMASNHQIKQLGEDNIQLAREVDRLISDRDRLEKKLIDLKIKYANGYLTRQNSGESTDEDELDNEANIFSTLSIDEKLRRKKSKRVLGSSSARKSATVFSAAKNWFSRSKKQPTMTPRASFRAASRPNEAATDAAAAGVAV